MKKEVQELIDQFLRILHLYSVITRKPKDYGTGDMLYFTEVHTIEMVGRNREINITKLAELMGVTKGAISQTITKLMAKGMIMRIKTTNRKEVSLSLTEKGLIVNREQESFRKELFAFADSLYQRATPDDVKLVKRLFAAILRNMQERVKKM
ncbi:MAG: MarR family winged helix-turn-helix transcriptional regulator [Bacteroidales bacterium]